MLRRTLAVVAVLVTIVGGSFAGASYAFFSAEGKASQRFHVGEAGALTIKIAPIRGSLVPSGAVDVDVTLANESAWAVRVRKVAFDGVTDLPEGCPASVFSFAAINVNATVDAGESRDVRGQLRMQKNAPAECAGADPLLHLQVT